MLVYIWQDFLFIYTTHGEKDNYKKDNTTYVRYKAALQIN